MFNLIDNDKSCLILWVRKKVKNLCQKTWKRAFYVHIKETNDSSINLFDTSFYCFVDQYFLVPPGWYSSVVGIFLFTPILFTVLWDISEFVAWVTPKAGSKHLWAYLTLYGVMALPVVNLTYWQQVLSAVVLFCDVCLHRWLHNCSVTKESASRSYMASCDFPFLWIFGFFF